MQIKKAGPEKSWPLLTYEKHLFYSMFKKNLNLFLTTSSVQ